MVLLNRVLDPVSRLRTVKNGDQIGDDEAFGLAGVVDLNPLMALAASRRDQYHGSVISYSRKVFIPLTYLCRDVCHYCTFAHSPRRGEKAFLTHKEVLKIAHAGAAAGCHEALFTLGANPEKRYKLARKELKNFGNYMTLKSLNVDLLLSKTTLGQPRKNNLLILPMSGQGVRINMERKLN